MVNPGLKINLFEFQEQAVLNIIEITSKKDSKQTALLKAPTGSGKTIMLIEYIDQYLNNINENTAFVWLCPGKGNLEEQSKSKMDKLIPSRKTQNLNEALLGGFGAETTTFINWELVTKKGNTAIRDSERKNLFEKIDEAKRTGIEFIIIIDEEHSNNTAKATDIINSFVAKNIIRVSATTQKNKRFEFYEIDEADVISSGLITKALYVNEGLVDNVSIDDDYDILLDLAEEKRKRIEARYKELSKAIRPLVLIQFPNARPDTIKKVEKKLEDMGYTYDNGMVAKWVSEEKINIDNIIANDAQPLFLLMKQAITTGWDCPRAKILIKLREDMSETFEIQTIGRIRRMPEAKHYEDDLLDFCFVYTFDEKYKSGLLANVDRAYETRRLFLKEKCKTFTLEKQIRDLDYDGIGEREVLDKVYEFFQNKYKLDKDRKLNRVKLEADGFIFGDELFNNILQGKFIKTESIIDDTTHYITTRKKISTHKNGIDMLHAVDAIKKVVGMKNRTVKAILERLFRKDFSRKYKLLLLSTSEFYAFIINNEYKLKEDFREITQGMAVQQSLVLSPKVLEFKIPEQDFFKYDVSVKNEVDYLNNAYKYYTSGNTTSLIRSQSELLFEKHCESREDIDWIYKNGDTGQQYFSIVYIDGIGKQGLFYADYIVKKKDGTIWIIETKGGEARGESKNIDKQILNKFNAFKNYAKNKNISWGFVRDKDGELYINNTEYVEEMSNENWVFLTDEF